MGKHLAAGSSFTLRVLNSASAEGSMEIFSPGFSAFAKSPEYLPSGFQTPERSGLPSLVRGAGPVGAVDWARAAAASKDKPIVIRASCIFLRDLPLAAPSAAADGRKCSAREYRVGLTCVSIGQRAWCAHPIPQP